MTNKIILIMMLLTCLSTPAQKKEIGEKILVVYFSHSGNTRTVAEQITRPTRADLFEIQPQEAYPNRLPFSRESS